MQGDKTGDSTLADAVKAYIKEKYAKPGEVFLGIVHRLDRPVSGVVVYARTSKALSRLNEMFRLGKVHKTYHAITPNIPLARSGQPQTLYRKSPLTWCIFWTSQRTTKQSLRTSPRSAWL